MGVDLARYGLDEPIGNVDSNAILSAVKAFQSADPDGREWAVRDIAEWAEIGGMGPRSSSGRRRCRRRRVRTRLSRRGVAEPERCVTTMCPPVVGMT
jgi:hypothetical protein